MWMSKSIIRVKEGGDEERILEISPEGDSKAKYKRVVVDLDKGGDYDVITLPTDGKMLFFIDGKKASRKEVKNLDPDQIATINVWKGPKAVEKYGKKAADGVVEITTKKE